ncbi:hypothetical protein EV198_3658 [Roseivirga ehrenbergii]|uniref:DUF1579 domain-containing protein n=1 Tax=Roseivirga ehrenbergii (strain DSM 102268 / JCM 13514 / KCTC 12282 / NCIMB 14502 / KMM 6017) TaxID=279360 RepID=A0A150XK13_ROSEK|nr:hypothetical protein [Roseivirga ehrenbergii]KYG79077.1 hypothetical protein MB14_17360 [Roseivirga ehrenbergii]TCK99126.1 hypothetical protein EV198_3658 [Roseivirga ehrenbergii]
METESIKMKTVKVIFIFIVVLYGALVNHVANAQEVGTLNKEAMEKLSNWIGQWEGEGWSMDESRQKAEFTVVENIQRKIGGMAILAEGVGTNKSDGKVGFQSLGVLYYNNERKQYEMKSLLADGNMALTAAQLNNEGQFIWGFDVPGGSIQYTTTLKEDTWHEKGEFIMANGQAFTILEMNLTKLK